MLRVLYVIAAMLIMAAVPVSQLRLVAERVTCCCPDPANCHCPDHDNTDSDHPSMKACHKSSDAFAGAQLSELLPPRALAMHEPPRHVAVVHLALARPHAAPPPARPAAPS